MMNAMRFAIGFGLAALFLTGCVATRTDLQRLEARMLKYDARLERLEGTADAIETQMSTQAEDTRQAIFARINEAQTMSRDLRTTVIALEEELRRTRGDLDTMQTGLNYPRAGTRVTIRGELQGLQAQVLGLRQQLETMMEQLSGLGGKEVSADALYEQARAAYKAAEYERAAEMFGMLIRLYPKHALVSNAHFWIGESYFARKDWVSALDKYKLLMEQFAKSNKAPDAYLKAAMALKEMGEADLGRAVVQELVERYPDAAQVKAAGKLFP